MIFFSFLNFFQKAKITRAKFFGIEVSFKLRILKTRFFSKNKKNEKYFEQLHFLLQSIFN